MNEQHWEVASKEVELALDDALGYKSVTVRIPTKTYERIVSESDIAGIIPVAIIRNVLIERFGD